MRAYVHTRTDFGSIRLIWQNLAEVDQAGRIWQNSVKASSSICRVFYWDIPTVTRLVPLYNPSIDTYVCNNKEDFNFLYLVAEDDYLITSGNFVKIQAYGIVTITVNTPSEKLKMKLSYIALLRATDNDIHFDLGWNVLYCLATGKIVYYVK